MGRGLSASSKPIIASLEWRRLRRSHVNKIGILDATRSSIFFREIFDRIAVAIENRGIHHHHVRGRRKGGGVADCSGGVYARSEKAVRSARISKPEPQNRTERPHRRCGDRQAVGARVHYRVDVSVVHVIEQIIGFHA